MSEKLASGLRIENVGAARCKEEEEKLVALIYQFPLRVMQTMGECGRVECAYCIRQATYGQPELICAPLQVANGVNNVGYILKINEDFKVFLIFLYQ